MLTERCADTFWNMNEEKIRARGRKRELTDFHNQGEENYTGYEETIGVRTELGRNRTCIQQYYVNRQTFKILQFDMRNKVQIKISKYQYLLKYILLLLFLKYYIDINAFLIFKNLNYNKLSKRFKNN